MRPCTCSVLAPAGSLPIGSSCANRFSAASDGKCSGGTKADSIPLSSLARAPEGARCLLRRRWCPTSVRSSASEIYRRSHPRVAARSRRFYERFPNGGRAGRGGGRPPPTSSWLNTTCSGTLPEILFSSQDIMSNLRAVAEILAGGVRGHLQTRFIVVGGSYLALHGQTMSLMMRTPFHCPESIDDMSHRDPDGRGSVSAPAPSVRFRLCFEVHFSLGLA